MCSSFGERVTARAVSSVLTKVVLPRPEAPKTTSGSVDRSMVSRRCSAR